MRFFPRSASANNAGPGPHRHGHPEHRSQGSLRAAVAATLATFLIEVAGGYYSGSMALISDAGHVFLDMTGLLLALAAQTLAERPASDRRTFGLHRFEVLAGLANGLLVAGLAVWILWESLGRFSANLHPRLGPMAGVGLFGLLMNLWVAGRLRTHSHDDVNVRGAYLHVASDAMASVGVLAAAGIISLTGWTAADPLVSLGIALLLLVNAGGVLRESLNLLLEGVPRSLRMEEVEGAIRSVPGVRGVDDLHVWGLCSHVASLSAHVAVDDRSYRDPAPLLKTINAVLKDRFHIIHTTIQCEPCTSPPTAGPGPGDAGRGRTSRGTHDETR